MTEATDTSKLHTRRKTAVLALQAALLALAGLPLLAGCLDAPFLTYDDPVHIQQVPQVYGKAPMLDLFKVPDDTYRPITFISYRIDYELFGRRMEAAGNKNWAPGIRVMNWLYHSLAAIALWRVLLLLGLSSGEALFGALFFAVHPTCCETVGWVSERKNALAAMFGFAALYTWLKLETSRWCIPVTALLYALSLFSKPSSLGLLPVFVLFDLFGNGPGLRGEVPTRFSSPKAWLFAALAALPLAALAGFDTWMNLIGHAPQLIAPPGGTALTGALTDAEILVRYLINLVAPFNLSAAYYVTPVTSPLNLAFLGHCALLAALTAVTIALARSKRRAILGWLWFVGALGPNLNLIGTIYLMTDRYIYLSIPGMVLVLVECVAGVQQRMPRQLPTLARSLAAVSLIVLALTSVLRSADFRTSYRLFLDATIKEPRSAFAHYGLMQAYTHAAVELETPGPTSPPPLAGASPQELRRLAQQERLVFLDQCPDARRIRIYAAIVLDAAGYEFEHGNLTLAEKYYTRIAFPDATIIRDDMSRAAALRGLALLSMKSSAGLERAYTLATQALEAGDAPDRSLIVRAKAALAWAENRQQSGEDALARRLRDSALHDLLAVPKDSPCLKETEKLIEQITHQ